MRNAGPADNRCTMPTPSLGAPAPNGKPMPGRLTAADAAVRSWEPPRLAVARTEKAAPRATWMERARAGLEVAGLALLALYLFTFVARNVSSQGDLRTYLLAARAALAGLDPYRPEQLSALAGRVVVPFVYPPIALLPFLAFASVTRATVAALWIGAKLALLIGLVIAWRRWLSPRDAWLPLALVAVFGWNQAALWDLRTGNVALFECALLWSAFGCFAAGRRTAFAALVVAAACFKLTPAAFLLLLLVPTGEERPRPLRLIGWLALLGALVWAPTLIGPAARWDGFLTHLPAANTLGESNPSMFGLLTVLSEDAGVAEPQATRLAAVLWALYALALIALSVPFLRRAWRGRDARHWVMGAVFLYVLLAPRPMAYGFLLLVPAPLFFAPPPFDRPAGRWLLALALSVQGLTRAANHPGNSVLYHYAPALLALCVWLLVTRDREPRSGPAPRRPRLVPRAGFPVVMLCAALCGMAGSAFADPPPPALVPMPRDIHPLPGVVALNRTWTIVIPPGADDEPAARLLAEEASQDYGWTWKIARAPASTRSIELRAIAPPAHRPPLFVEQGYRLEIARDRIVIEGVTSTGRFYGAQTLRQLLRAAPGGRLSCLRVKDYPALRWRGISDDISRGQISTVEDFKATIRRLAGYKINLYQLYIEDMFRFESAPAIGRGRGALTRDELAQLVEEGRRNHVVVSPIFETLAHQDRLLSVDEHRRFAAGEAEVRDLSREEVSWESIFHVVRRLFSGVPRAPGRGATASATFSAHDPGTLRFVESLVDEIAAVTGGPFFHIGGDEWEPPVTRTGTAVAADDDIRDYGRYLGKIAGHLRARHGCRAMVYGDVILDHPDAARDLPRSVVVVDWHYDPQDSFPSLRRLDALGFRDVIVSPGLWTWRTFYPNQVSAFRSVAAFARAGKRAGATGCVAAAWGDDGAENLRENNWAGYAFTAAAAWESDSPAPAPFLRRFVAAHYGADSPALARAEALLGTQEFEGVGWAGRLYHRAPAVRPRQDSTVVRMKALAADMREVERDLSAAGSGVRFERDHLAVADHCARRYLYIAGRELFLDAVGRELDGRSAAALPAAQRERIASGFGRLEATADSLAAEYGRLWLRHNRPEGLETTRARMEKQGDMFRRLGALARTGRLAVDSTFTNMQALSADAP